MGKVKRGGLTLKGGKIGRCNVLRQQLLMPGERMNVDITGKVRLESLRERDVMRINATLLTFMQPVRWLWPEITDYIREGEDTSVVRTGELVVDFSKYGLGSYNSSLITTGMPKFYKDAVLRCYNEWLKWPEDPDITDWTDQDGAPAVPLAKAWSRCRYDVTPDDSDDYTVATVSNMDVRNLAEIQGKFRSAMKRDVLSFGRWMELSKEAWNQDGSREVDQVPMLIDKTEVGVNPREMPATDGASLGQWQSLYDFDVNHSIRGITAPEHMVLTYMLVIRFPSITDSVHPLAINSKLPYHDMVADPEFYASAQPQAVTLADTQVGGGSTQLGYLPAGWRWRTDHDVIGARIDEADSFPYMQQPTSQSNAKDATRIKNAFRSERFGHYVADVYFHENSIQPIGDSIDSYLAGMTDDTRNVGPSGAEFPHGGKQL